MAVQNVAAIDSESLSGERAVCVGPAVSRLQAPTRPFEFFAHSHTVDCSHETFLQLLSCIAIAASVCTLADISLLMSWKFNARCGRFLPLGRLGLLLLLLLFGLECLPSTTALPPRPISITKRSTPAVAAGAVILRAVAAAAPPPTKSTASSVLNRAVTARPSPSVPASKPTIAPHAVQNKTSVQLIAVAAQVQAQRLSASAVVKTIQRVNHQAPCPPTTREVPDMAIFTALYSLVSYFFLHCIV